MAVYAALFMSLDSLALSSERHLLQLAPLCNRGGAELMRLWEKFSRGSALPKPLEVLALCGLSEIVAPGQEGTGDLASSLQQLLVDLEPGESAVLVVDGHASSVHKQTALYYANYDPGSLGKDGKSLSSVSSPGESLFLSGMELESILGRYISTYGDSSPLCWLNIDHQYLSRCDHSLFANFQSREARELSLSLPGMEDNFMTPPPYQIGAPLEEEGQRPHQALAQQLNLDEELVFRCMKDNTRGDLVALFTFFSLGGLSLLVLVAKAFAVLLGMIL